MDSHATASTNKKRPSIVSKKKMYYSHANVKKNRMQKESSNKLIKLCCAHNANRHLRD